MFKRLIAFLTSYSSKEIADMKKALAQVNEATLKQNFELKRDLEHFTRINKQLSSNINYFQHINTQLMIEIEGLKLKNKSLATAKEMLTELDGDFSPFTPEEVKRYVEQRTKVDFVSASRARSLNEASKRSVVITSSDSFTMTGVDMANGNDETITQTVGSSSNE